MVTDTTGVYMKKFLAVTALLTLTTSAFAATSGTLLLQGIVAKKVSIVVTAEGVASALDLETSQTDLKVATVNEKSNSNTGYKITITSANLGKLKRGSGSEVFSYSLKYGGAAVGLSTAAGSVFTSTSASAVNFNKDLAVSYTGVANETMVEGTYSDTLTLNIASN
jgi:hypothetical protein